AFLEQQARSHGRHNLFALTTRTAHWFIEQGFEEVSAEMLPEPRRTAYHNGRNSKVFKKPL
ncbi:MAG TPA: N-acetylglutamate synthase, partial [Psychrobacter sp.]|nr:N-acetylglutamate synthase [Psychrobacter sp.]